MTARRRRQTVTMADVAAAAGVSITTVSHVVNRTRPVGVDATRKVQDALESTGYLADPAADRAATSSQTLGLAMSAMTNPYFAELVHALDRRAAALDYAVLLAETHDDPDTEHRAVRALLRRKVDGLIIAPSADSSAGLDLAAQREVPVVLIDRFIAQPLDQVATENRNAAAGLVDHLIGLGHRRIGLITGPTGISTTTERVEGYRDALARAEIPYDPDLVTAGEAAEPDETAPIGRLLGLAEPPTAVATMNNQTTIATLRGLKRAGLRVPQDIALVAFDDFPWADLFEPGLTAVAQPIDAIGAQAIDLLLTRIGDPTIPPRQIRIQPTFVHRSSCGCPS